MTKIIKVLKDFTYYALIKEAIYSTENMQATASEIFDYFVLRFPLIFNSLNSMTWKGNIRQVLSKNPEFIKRAKSGCSKQHYWSHRPMEVLLAEKRQSECITVSARPIVIDKYPNYMRQRRLVEQDSNTIQTKQKNTNEQVKVVQVQEANENFEFCSDFDYTKLFETQRGK